MRWGRDRAELLRRTLADVIRAEVTPVA
jgi:hypothetical protein